MIKKLSAVFLLLTMVLSLFSCTAAPEAEKATEPASQQSDKESAQIGNEFSDMKDRIEAAQSATAVNDESSFSKQLRDTETAAVSYEGTENINIDTKNSSDKTITVKTEGKVTLSSPAGSVIIDGAGEGFTAKAKADTLIINGSSVTADIKSETGKIVVNGKDVTINVQNSSIEKLIVFNSYVIINNLTQEDIDVTLANGAKTRVPAGNTYNVRKNTLEK